ncbi:hypothetical protein [Kribbella deserti]|uniref:Uncharacterized protein n=1 Tax=Kribbella deserti TaxID=1926257 RepID=A0ABV6QPH2_9ACTN
MAELSSVGLPIGRTYAATFVDESPFTLLATNVAAAARPGQLPARLAVEAMEAGAVALPLLAPPAEGAGAAARAGLLGATSTAWIAGPAIRAALSTLRLRGIRQY